MRKGVKFSICKIMARRPSWSNCNCTNVIIYLLGNFLTSQSWKEISERNWTKKEEPRRNQNLIHVFGKRSWKEISERNWTKKEEPRRNQNLIHPVCDYRV